jgi:serine protease Do
MAGEVVGITTSKYSGFSSSGASIEGIGFAIPMDDVKLYIIELIQKGYISRPYMGVMVRDMTEFNGVYVDSVEAGGSAAVAGIRGGDIIISIDGTAVSSIAELTKLLQSFKVGQTATIKVYRMRQILDLQITFSEKPHTTSGSGVTPDNSGVPNQGSYQEWFDYFFGKD